MDTEEKPVHRSLDQRIASALNGEATTALLSDLIIETEAALPINLKALEAERIRTVDPTNPDPERSKAKLDRIQLERDRLQAALPILQQRYRLLDQQEQAVEWSEDYALVERDRDKLAAELHAFYPEMVDQFVSLFQRIEHCDKNVDIINSTAPSGEKRRLKGVELTARDLDYFTTVQPSLAKTVQLPFPGETSRLAWPPQEVSFSVLAADQAHAIMASRSAAYSADWHEARKLEDAKKLEEWARRNAILEEQQEAAKREYVKAQHRAARGER